MAKLTAKERKGIPAKDFALGKGHYPIEDASHARNALARVSQHGTPEEKAKVRAAVHSKYPEIGEASADKSRNVHDGRFMGRMHQGAHQRHDAVGSHAGYCKGDCK
jgi:hypothetical protein